MARLAALVAALAGALWANTINAAPARVDTVTDLCNPVACMALALVHSDCFDGFDPGSVITEGQLPKPNSFTQCVCANATLEKSYMSCYGFCTIDKAAEPFCGQSVDDAADDTEEAANKTVNKVDKAEDAIVEHAQVTAPAQLHERDDIAERDAKKTTRVTGKLRDWINFCGVPGQACGEKMIATETAEVERHEVTAAAELKNADISSREPKKISGKLRDWINFCGVPGQACGEKMVAAPTAVVIPTGDLGSDFIDIGDVRSEGLEGKIGGGAKRDTAAELLVPTALETVKGAIRPSN